MPVANFIQESSDDSDDSDDESGSDSSDSDSDSDEEEKPKDSKKRKADEESAPTQKKSKTEQPAEGDSPNLFVGNLSWNVDEEWLASEFQEFGELSGVRIVTDRESGRSRG